MARINFGEWLPDLQRLGSPGVFIKNVVPVRPGYRSWNRLLAATDALPEASLGMFSTVGSDGVSASFTGTATGLFRANGSAWDDVSAQAYEVEPSGRWTYGQFGDLVVAAAYPHKPQKINLAGGLTFSDLSATAPVARCVATVRAFLVLGDVDGISNRVQWSPYQTPDGDWTPSLTTLAGWANLAGSGGGIKAIVGGEYGIVFRERSIFRMSFAGPPLIFQFDEVEPGRGTIAGGSVVHYGRHIYYVGQDGFYVHDGVQSHPIGKNKIDKTFFDDLDPSNAGRIVAAVDDVNSLVMWAYPGAGNEGGTPNRILFYNWSERRFGYCEQQVEALGSYRSPGVTMEQLGQQYATMLDVPPYPLDSRFWAGGALSMAAFDTSHKLATFSGDPLPATIETPHFDLIEWRRALMTKLRPLFEGSIDDDMAIFIGTKDSPHEDITWGDNAFVLDAWGDCYPYVSSPYHAIRFQMSDSFDRLWGVLVDGQDDGEAA